MGEASIGKEKGEGGLNFPAEESRPRIRPTFVSAPVTWTPNSGPSLSFVLRDGLTRGSLCRPDCGLPTGRVAEVSLRQEVVSRGRSRWGCPWYDSA